MKYPSSPSAWARQKPGARQYAFIVCKQSSTAHCSSSRLRWGLEEGLLQAWGLSAGQRVKGRSRDSLPLGKRLEETQPFVNRGFA